MKVILNADMDNLGELGDIVEVKPGFARNYLLPRQLAVAVNKNNLEMMKARRRKAEQQFELEKMSALEKKQTLDGIALRFERKSGENDVLFGSVTTADIEKKLAEMGIEIERKKLHLEEQIKRLGNYTCKIKLVKDVDAEIKIEVLPEGGEIPAPASAEEAVAEEIESKPAAPPTPAVEEIPPADVADSDTGRQDAPAEDAATAAEEVEARSRGRTRWTRVKRTPGTTKKTSQKPETSRSPGPVGVPPDRSGRPPGAGGPCENGAITSCRTACFRISRSRSLTMNSRNVPSSGPCSSTTGTPTRFSPRSIPRISTAAPTRWWPRPSII